MSWDEHPDIAEAESRRDNPSNYDEPPEFGNHWEAEAQRILNAIRELDREET